MSCPAKLGPASVRSVVFVAPLVTLVFSFVFASTNVIVSTQICLHFCLFFFHCCETTTEFESTTNSLELSNHRNNNNTKEGSITATWVSGNADQRFFSCRFEYNYRKEHSTFQCSCKQYQYHYRKETSFDHTCQEVGVRVWVLGRKRRKASVSCEMQGAV